MKIFIIALMTMISLKSLANDPIQFKGEWLGTGVYRRAGVQTFCKTFEMKFDGNRYLMNFLGGSRSCDLHDEKFASVSMAYNNGQLLYNGKVVGTITKNLLEVKFSMPEESGNIRNWRMSMRVEGNNMVYEESRTMNQEQTPLISFAGIMSKQ
jgi:hypothetical protein